MTQIRLHRNSHTPASAGGPSSEPSPDTPLPSTEEPESPHAFTGSDTTTSQNENYCRTPSISVSPPPVISPFQPAEPGSSQVLGTAQLKSPTTNGIADGISQLQLAERDPLANLQDIATSLETSNGVQASGTSSEALATPNARRRSESLTPGASPRRRRSSSRTVIEPHRIIDEVPPEDKFHAAGFQKNLNNTKALVQKLQSVLGSNALHQEPESKMHNLHDHATRLVNFQFPTSRVVGFVGDSGSGKSSVLNSLLDKQGLVRTSSGGQACTCLVTEFHYHEHDSFSIEVELFGEDELLDQLRPMLCSYRQAKLHIDEITEQSDREYLEEAAKLAEDTFHAMFRGSSLPERDFLLSGDENEVLESFRSFIADVRPSISTGVVANLTRRACTDQLDQLSSNIVNEDEPAKWPYIRKIRVNLNAHILSRGLVLVDLPGLRDLNAARRNITERFLIECDEIFAVCSISRAATDVGIREVFELAEQARLSNVDIICTRSDDIHANEAKRDWKGGRAERIGRLQDAMELARAEVADYTLQIDELAELEDPFPEESAELAYLTTKRTASERSLAAYDLQLQTFLITNRNELVSQSLRQEYGGVMTNRTPMVFCVSNTMYWKYRHATCATALQFLQLSGIIGLRQYSISMVSENQHRIATRFMRHDVPSLLSDIELWLHSGADTLDAERRARITRTMNGLEHRLISSLLGATSNVPTVSRMLLERFTVDIYEEQDVSAWSAVAQAAGEEWDGWHHATYAAFCRHYGRHDTRAVGFHDWNEEVIQGMVNDLTGPWQGLRSALLSRHMHVSNSIESSTDGAIEYLEAELRDDLDRRATLGRTLRDHCGMLQGGAETAFEEAERSFRILEINTLTSLRTSYIGAVMEAPYRTCNTDYGPGCDRRRKGVMSRALSNHGLFSDIMTRLRSEFRVLADTLQASIDNAVESYRQQVKSTLDLVRDENTAIESQQDPAFHNRVDEAVQSAREEMQSVEQEVPELD